MRRDAEAVTTPRREDCWDTAPAVYQVHQHNLDAINAAELVEEMEAATR